ncbi:hypothetical protein PSTT_08040 [Puccinia striiformis]|uniref:Thioredoxin domain-containing protein n=1 Tax=Puccinia striiformis TaxID=27350 RepID=A0A2S4VE05_9BASI|nr:hypothetical protein PSTT_08040 [Puccinia striiformis]
MTIGKNPHEECCTIVYFWAAWVEPCRVLTPSFEKCASEDTSGKLKYFKVEVDEASEIASEAAVCAMPAFTVYKKGDPVDWCIGANPHGLMSTTTNKTTN